MKIYFVTTSAFKAKELESFLASARVPESLEIPIITSPLTEPLVSDISEIVTEKALAAYALLGLPCVVEHSGLLMDALPGLPGGLGQVIWRSIGDRMCGFLRADDSRAATARSVLGYCDGWRVHIYMGETRGSIADRARGEYQCNWDPIFIPDGSDRTYGEMGLALKSTTSPSGKAWTAFLTALATNRGGHH
jgi:XTP/dITP diphosphohydrolase